MKSTLTETLESELNIVQIDLRIEDLQQMEAIKPLQKNDQFITNNTGKKVSCKKSTPLTNLGHQAKQVLTVMSKHHSLLIKLAKSITSCGTSYEGDTEVIKLATDHTFKSTGQANNLFIYTDSQSVVKATMTKSRESYHNETITQI